MNRTGKNTSPRPPGKATLARTEPLVQNTVAMACSATLAVARPPSPRRADQAAKREVAVPESQVVQEVLAANRRYAEGFGDKGKLSLPPARRFAILTCMDARLDPAKVAGLAEGDAHVIRNAGGRASDDAIRSLVISHKLLGTNEWFVIHHTDCGMELFSDQIMGDLLAESLAIATYGPEGWRNPTREGGSPAGRYMAWLTIRDLAQSVVDDIQRIRSHPLVPPTVPIYGYIYDVRTGRLSEVAGASEAGRALA
jgi:carbonic anhydrase